MLLRAVLISVFLFLPGTRGTGQHFAQTEPAAADSVVNYRTLHDLMIVPVIINQTVRVHLILEPKCKSLILFGKRFYKLLENSNGGTRVPGAVGNGLISFGNQISIGPLMEDDIDIVIVPNYNPMNFFNSVNGIIGPGLLAKFHPIMDAKNQTLIFGTAGLPSAGVGKISSSEMKVESEVKF
jgi:hypothetical protein